MENEKVIYRTRVIERYKAYPRSGECIVSSARVVIRWSNGEVQQFPITYIRSIKFHEYMHFTFSRDIPEYVEIKLVSNETLSLQASRELASKIQGAMMPF